MSEAAIRGRISDASGWQVQRQLGRGQYGTAYLVDWAGKSSNGDDEQQDGTRTAGEQAVAKVVGLEFLPEKEHNLAFQEVEMMRNLNHPHIVALRDHFMTEANLELVIVMEFCDSGDLRGEVKWRTQAKPPSLLAESQIMTWFVQLTLALNYMHHRHILHRDLKSSNIFLTANDSDGHDVKIGDFGISRVLEGTVDVAATVVGTPYYMSPEVCKSEPYGFKSDIWALGCVLYEMCMLKHAFESQSLLGLVYKIVSETYDPIPPQYSEQLRTLIDRVLDKSHFTRPSGKELVADPYVRRFAKNLQEGADSSTMPPQTKNELPGAVASQPTPAAAAAAPGSAPPGGLNLPPGPTPKRASLAPKAPVPQRAAAATAEGMRSVEPSPSPPAVGGAAAGAAGDRGGAEEQPVRREWCAPPFVAAAKPLDEADLRAEALLSRIRRALLVRRQNWLQVFASFDRKGDGQLQEADFERAVISMALGLSDQEIREVRSHLQGAGNYVPVDHFGSCLHKTHPDVVKLEDWGRSVLAELTQEAAKAGGGAGGAGPGASVRVHGLQSAAGMKLNGAEGVVDKWDAMSCRWVVKLSNGNFKSIRNENLQVLRPSSAVPTAAGGNAPDTAGIYRLLCEGGETAVLPEHFLGVVQKLLPQLDDCQRKRLLLLLPKSPEGRVDVPEVLAQLVAPVAAEQTIRMPGPSLGGQPPHGSPNRGVPGAGPRIGGFRAPPGPGPMMQPPMMSPMKGSGMPLSPSRPPGAVASPRGPGAVSMSPAPSAMMMGPSGGSAPSDFRGERVRAEAALLRLAQRLFGRVGRAAAPGPGLDVLRLFASRPDEIWLEEFCDAASVLPIGISRAEVQSVFTLIRESAGPMLGVAQNSGALTFAQLVAATEAAYSAGVPSEAGLEYVDFTRLAPALQRLASNANAGCAGRATAQEFRVTLMQAEPYLTHSQLEWLMMLTDKDGEGRLLPWSLLSRLADARPSNAANLGAARAGGITQAMVPPCPALSSSSPVAPTVQQRSLVTTAICARIRGRLYAAGPQLGLDRVLGLFDVSVAGDKVSRSVLSSLLGHLQLGISIVEADEIAGQLSGAALGGTQVGIRFNNGDTVQLSRLYDMLQRTNEPEAEATISHLREAARQRLQGHGSAFASAASARTEGGEWIPAADFQRCLAAALMEHPMGPLTGEEEDRVFLLTEKNACGDVRWKAFAQAYAGWQDLDVCSEPGERISGVLFRTPDSPKKKGAANNLRTEKPEHTGTQQSWRSAKTAQVPSRTVVAPLNQVSSEPDSPLPPRSGLCRCRRRYGV